MRTPSNLRRAGIAFAGAALLLAGATGASAANGPQPGTAYDIPAPDRAAATLPAPGSELQFMSVAPCRILDTRVAGGPLNNSSRDFSAVAPYTAQGGLAAGCDIPENAVSIQVNVGATQVTSVGFVKGWAAGEAQPNASILNYNPNAAAANMVTLPLSASGTFTLFTNMRAQLFADVAGYYVRPLYAIIDAETDPTALGVRQSSGLINAAPYILNDAPEPGYFVVTFDRDVTTCVPVATDYSFTGNHFLAVDPTFLGLPPTPANPVSDPNSILVQVRDAAGNPSGTIFNVSLTC